MFDAKQTDVSCLMDVAVVVEAMISARRNLKLYDRPDMLVSFGMGIISLLVELFPKLLAFIAFIYLHEWSPLRDVVERQWWAWQDYAA